MFRGSSFHTIDAKGRIIIPARFRDVVKACGQDAVMITRMDSCLFAYTPDEWSKLENKVLALPTKSDSMRRFQRTFIGASSECKCDKQGRVLVPPFLKAYSGLEKDIVLVGVLNRFEIWSRENWDKENALMEEDMTHPEVREEIAQLGL